MGAEDMLTSFWSSGDNVPCPVPECVDGKIILNPDWPNGTDPYCENCTECGGSGEVDRADLP